MKKEKLKKLEEIVEEILRADELARRDDCYLILETIRIMYPHEISKKFEEVMFSAKNRGISFESITRARRKIQKKYPELKDQEMAEIRNEEQKEYVEFAKEKNK